MSFQFNSLCDIKQSKVASGNFDEPAVRLPETSATGDRPRWPPRSFAGTLMWGTLAFGFPANGEYSMTAGCLQRCMIIRYNHEPS